MSANKGITAIYNGGLTSGIQPIQYQYGAGIGKTFKQIERTAGKINTFAKDNKLISKASALSDITGTRAALDAATGGTFSRATQAGIKAGYGKKKKSGSKKSKPKKSGSKKSKKC